MQRIDVQVFDRFSNRRCAATSTPSILSLIVVFLSVWSCPVVADQPIPRVTWSLRGTIGAGGSLQEFSLSDSQELTASPFTTDFDFGLAPNEGVWPTFFGEGEIAYIDNSWRTTFSVDHESAGTSTASFTLDFLKEDSWQLMPLHDNAVLPDLSLRGYFGINASYDLETFQDDTNVNGQPYNVSVTTGVDVGNFGFDVGDLGRFDFSNTRAGVEFGVAGQDQGQLNYVVSTDLDFSIGDAVMDMFSGNSFNFEYVQFSDGSTPEDHGFAFVRASGRIAPVAPVPEPSSLPMVACGLGLLLRRRR